MLFCSWFIFLGDAPRFPWANIKTTSFNQVASNDWISFFLWMNNMTLCKCLVFSLPTCLPVDTGCIFMLTIVNSPAINLRKQMFLWHTDFTSFGYVLNSVTTESYGTFISSFWKNVHTIFYGNYTNLYSHQRCMGILLSPHPSQHYLLSPKVERAKSVSSGFLLLWLLI